MALQVWACTFQSATNEIAWNNHTWGCRSCAAWNVCSWCHHFESKRTAALLLHVRFGLVDGSHVPVVESGKTYPIITVHCTILFVFFATIRSTSFSRTIVFGYIHNILLFRLLLLLFARASTFLHRLRGIVSQTCHDRLKSEALVYSTWRGNWTAGYCHPAPQSASPSNSCVVLTNLLHWLVPASSSRPSSWPDKSTVVVFMGSRV